MKCIECPHFKILYEPIKNGGDVWDLGKAKCNKYDLVTYFVSHRIFNKMMCAVESEQEESEDQFEDDGRREQ